MRNRLKTMAFLLSANMVVGLTACADAPVNTTQGMQAIQAMDYGTAVSFFAQAVSESEDLRQAFRGMGIAYMGLADYEQATACFKQALYLSDGLVESMDYDLNYYLAVAYAKSGHMSEAEETYNAILGMKSDEVEAYFLRGNVRMGLGKFTEAQEDFNQVVQMAPQDYDRLIQIFQVMDNYGYTDQGKSYLQAALEQGSSRMSAFDKGRIYYYLGEYQQAYTALEEARKGGGAEAYLYLGRAYEATGDYNYAANVYNAYLMQGTGNAEIYNQLGICELQKGEYQKALDAFQAGLKLEDNDILQSLSFNEIVAYEYLGDFKRAAVLMENYLQNYPDDANAQREYDFLRTR